jgi:hypothetical protein
MHSAILAAELPPNNRAGRETWQLFSAMIADLKGDPGIKQLGAKSRRGVTRTYLKIVGCR